MTIGENWRREPTESVAGVAQRRDHRRTRHVAPLASAAHRPEMDLRQEGHTPARRPRRDSPVGRADGGGESDTGYTRIQSALKNLGHQVGRSTIARILRSSGISPVPERPTSWQTFLRAHWGAIAAADFFTTEVWTW